jgi:hypothetical protein
MNTARSFALGLLLVGAVALAVAQEKQELQKAAPKEEPSCAATENYRIVAERPTLKKVKQALAVDPDGKVLVLFVGEGNKVQESEPIAYEQIMPADFPSGISLPKDEIVTGLRRFSCAQEGWRLWIVATLGFEQAEPGQYRPGNFVRVFRQSGQEVKPELEEPVHDLTDLTVDDVNDDQLTEIVFQYTEPGPREASTVLQMFQVKQDGTLRPVSLDNVKRDLIEGGQQVEMGLGDYRHGEGVLYTEQRIPIAKGWRVVRKYYDWNDETKRYELGEVVKTEELSSTK